LGGMVIDVLSLFGCTAFGGLHLFSLFEKFYSFMHVDIIYFRFTLILDFFFLFALLLFLI
jgi:hypothetical protein